MARAVHNARQFNASLGSQANNGLPVAVYRRFRAWDNRVLEYIFRKAVKLTPVDIGEARGGWVVATGTGERTGQRNLDPSGNRTIAEWIPVLRQANPFRPISFRNNVAHTVILEKGLFVPTDPGPSKDPRPGRKGKILVSGGYSTQAPRGIMENVILPMATARFG